MVSLGSSNFLSFYLSHKPIVVKRWHTVSRWCNQMCTAIDFEMKPSYNCQHLVGIQTILARITELLQLDIKTAIKWDLKLLIWLMHGHYISNQAHYRSLNIYSTATRLNYVTSCFYFKITKVWNYRETSFLLTYLSPMHGPFAF